MAMRRPKCIEDVRFVGLIGVCAACALAATVGNGWSLRGIGDASLTPPKQPRVIAGSWEESSTGADRLYGTVHTRDGRRHEGFIRWDRNEASWADQLDGVKVTRGAARQSGVRMGHILSIRPMARSQSALVTLRSGRSVTMRSRHSDLGSSMRGMVVSGQDRTTAKLRWEDLHSVHFHRAPPEARPLTDRLYGTLTTASGMQFTGLIGWDVDEVLKTDVLDGDLDAYTYEVPFGAIKSISRRNLRSSDIELTSGEHLTLSGSNDVDRGNRGITVSDPGLGEVKVEWAEFDRVVFHEAGPLGSLADFDGGTAITGTIQTTGGEEWSGEIMWDRDERQSWEMLNGMASGVALDIEFAHIALITRNQEGATVELRDGRSFDLRGSNDVDHNNGGIVVTRDGRMVTVGWEDFAELRLNK